MKIQNFDELAVTEGRRALLAIAEAGLQAIDTRKVIRDAVRLAGDRLEIESETVDLGTVRRLIFIGIGKCAGDAAAELETILGDRLSAGLFVDVKACERSAHIKALRGTHPLPSEENLNAAREIVAALQGLTEHDVVLFVISGGGSTLLFLPEDPRNREETTIFNALTAAGATIEELNVVRRHLSLARGGHLAKYAYPARVISLVFSDVPGDDLSTIASGPTVKDMTTMEDAAAILEKYEVQRVCPLEDCGLIETPKDDRYFARVRNWLVVSNKKALEAMAAAAEKSGYHAMIRSTTLTGEAREVGLMMAEELHRAPERSVLLWGGETTVTIRGNGKGGRNRELAAAALGTVREGEVLLSLASDGRDHGDPAGALCDTMEKSVAEKTGLDPGGFLRDNNVAPFFEKIGGLVMTGDTGSNVSDLMIALKN